MRARSGALSRSQQRVCRLTTTCLVVALLGCGGGGGGDGGGGGGSGTTVTHSTSSGGSGGSSSTPTGTGGDGGGSSCVDVQSDPKNCGVCGHDCLGGQCLAGVCQPVQLAGGLSTSAAVDHRPFSLGPSDVVWKQDPNKILQVSKAGGPVSTLFEEQYIVLPRPTADATHAYSGYLKGGGIWKIPLGGGEPVLVVAPPWNAIDIVLDGSTLFFNDNDVIYKVAIAGGAPSKVTDANTWTLTNPQFLVDATSVFWVNDYGGNSASFATAPKAGGSSSLVGNTIGDVASFTMDDAFIYWTEWSPSGTGDVFRMPKAGGVVTTIAAAQPDPVGIAVDATYVYWASRSGGAVLKAPKGGGAPLTVASGQSRPSYVAVDEVAVYWMTEGTDNDATVMKIAR